MLTDFAETWVIGLTYVIVMAIFALAKAGAAIVIVSIILIGSTARRISVNHRISVQLSSPPPAPLGAPPAVGLKWNPSPAGRCRPRAGSRLPVAAPILRGPRRPRVGMVGTRR